MTLPVGNEYVSERREVESPGTIKLLFQDEEPPTNGKLAMPSLRGMARGEGGGGFVFCSSRCCALSPPQEGQRLSGASFGTQQLYSPNLGISVLLVTIAYTPREV